jgi:hypothetical protein
MNISCFGAVWRTGLVLLLLLPALPAAEAAAQIDFRKRAAQAALCAGGAYGGYRLATRIAEREAHRLNLSPEETQQFTRSLQIGSALILCKGGAMLAGTIYEKLSERDLQARQREMEAAVAQAEAGTHTYVLPDSQLEGTLVVQPSVVEGNRECRTVVDHLAELEGGEPVVTRYCRNLPSGRYELDY